MIDRLLQLFCWHSYVTTFFLTDDRQGVRHTKRWCIKCGKAAGK